MIKAGNMVCREHWSEVLPSNVKLSEWIARFFPKDYQGWAIDVGASDGVSINSTYILEKKHGWTCLSVEANPDYEKGLRERRAWVEMCACDKEPGEAEFHVHIENPEAYSSLRPGNPKGMPKDMTWKKITVKVKTIDQLLERWEFPRLDALCVDVEGCEEDVLRGCDLKRWKPKVIVSEAWEAGHESEYLSQFGYKMVGRNGHNDLYLLGEA